MLYFLPVVYHLCYCTICKRGRMKLVSTRNTSKTVSFMEAVRNCIPDDGGLYVPADEEDLRPWIMYMNEKTPFTSITGTLTSALLKEEISPAISERLANQAFPFQPELISLTPTMSLLQLYHGPAGTHKDFGISFLASYLEHNLIIEGSTATVLAATTGELGSSITSAFLGKKHLRAVLLYPQGELKGIPESCLIKNGGNIYPIEIQGKLSDCFNLVREIYTDKELVHTLGLTLANTINIGRLLPQSFFYMYAFTRLKEHIHGDIFYSQTAGNFGNLVAGLYAWKFCLPVNGFITENTPALTTDSAGYCLTPDSMIPLNKRDASDPAAPSNLERLEQVFSVGSNLMRSLVFPQKIDSSRISEVIRDFYTKYNIFIDAPTATAFLAADVMNNQITEEGGHVVIIQKDHPALETKQIRKACGFAPKKPDWLLSRSEPIEGCPQIKNSKESLIKELKKL